MGARWSSPKLVQHREILSRCGNIYVRLALGLQQRDATGGFRAYRRTALERIDLAGVESQGYCFQVDLVHRIAAAELRIHEVPITFAERAKGESKMTSDIVIEALTRVTMWALQRQLTNAVNLARDLKKHSMSAGGRVTR